VEADRVNSKQVIVIRKDLNMRKGKMVAQGCHSALSFITKRFAFRSKPIRDECEFKNPRYVAAYAVMEYEHCNEMMNWLDNSFRKICVSVDSEEELKAVHQKALDAGLVSYLIEDNGATEFNGVKTLTCCAIGPHWDEKFEGITDHLPLL